MIIKLELAVLCSKKKKKKPIIFLRTSDCKSLCSNFIIIIIQYIYLYLFKKVLNLWSHQDTHMDNLSIHYHLRTLHMYLVSKVFFFSELADKKCLKNDLVLLYKRHSINKVILPQKFAIRSIVYNRTFFKEINFISWNTVSINFF